MQQQIMTGAACRIVINSHTVGFATSIRISRNTGVKEIYGLDQMTPQELAITGPYAVSGSLEGIRLRTGGGPDGFGLVNASHPTDMFFQQYSIIEIVDRKSNLVIARVTGVIFDADSVQLAAKGVMTFSANFKGMFLYNETSDKKNVQGFP